MNLNKFIDKNKLIILIISISIVLISFFLFIQFWIKGTPVVRVDEGLNFLINEKISATGQIPNYLTNYNGGQVQNGYPLYLLTFYNLYSIGGNLQNSLYLFNIFLLIILFLCFASFFILTKNFKIALIFLFSPIIMYQVFYVHADYYPAFICLFLAIISFKYLEDYLKLNNKKALFISVFLYSVLPMIHFFIFVLFSILIFFTILFYNNKKLLTKSSISIIYIISAIFVSGYYIFLTIFYKLSFSEPISFVPKLSVNHFNLIFPGATIIFVILGSLILFKIKKFYLFFPLILFLIWYLSSYTNFYFFANYRVVLILTLLLPITIYYFLKSINNKFLRLFIFIYLIFFGIFSYSQVQNNYSIQELNEVKSYFENNNIKNVTVLSYYRLNTWLPFLINNSSVPLANTDLYYTNYDVRNKVEKLFTPIDLVEKWQILKDLKVDYVVLMKEKGIQDGSLYKGVGDIFNEKTGKYFLKEETERLYIYKVQTLNNETNN